MRSTSIAGWCRLSLLLALTLAFAGTVNGAVDIEDLHPPKDGYTQLIGLEDGSTLNGKILEVTGDQVTVESSVGKVTISAARIKEIREVPLSDIRGGSYWFPNPNRTRLYLGPTARMTPKGEGSISSVYLFFPSVTYGLTDNISVAGGISLFPGVDFDDQLLYFTPKVGIGATKDLSFAVSALITVVPEWGVDDDEEDGVDISVDEDVEEPFAVGIVFGVATYGTDDKSVTFGLGYGYADEDFADKPAVIFGGEYRVARRMSLVTENWVLPGVEPVIISYGVRFFGEGLAVDLAFINVASEDFVPVGIPYVGFTWNY